MSAPSRGGSSIEANYDALSTWGFSLAIVVGDSACWSLETVSSWFLAWVSSLIGEKGLWNVDVTSNMEMSGSCSWGGSNVFCNIACAAVAFALASVAGIGDCGDFCRLDNSSSRAEFMVAALTAGGEVSSWNIEGALARKGSAYRGSAYRGSSSSSTTSSFKLNKFIFEWSSLGGSNESDEGKDFGWFEHLMFVSCFIKYLQNSFYSWKMFLFLVTYLDLFKEIF